MDDEDAQPWANLSPEEAAGGASPVFEWVEHVSEAGESYYCNVATGETSWTRPEAQQQQDSASAWTETDVQVDPPSDGSTEQCEDHQTIAAVDEGVDEANEVLESVLNQVETEAVGGTIGFAADAFDTGRLAPDVSTDPASPLFSERGTTPSSKRDEVTEWLELYDPEQGVLYYFSPLSGQLRWEPPPENIRHCDSDAVLSTVVSLQSAARSQQARARVVSMRQERQRQPEDADHDNEGKQDINENDPGAESCQQWVEVYDPATQQQYYYSPRTNATRWDAPDTFVSSADDRKVAAAISIQSLSRGRIARKQINERRMNKPQHSQRQMQELPLHEADREAMHRREMVQEELLQLAGGDRFWGLDIYESEILRQRIEEELMAKGFSTVIQQSDPMNTPLHDMSAANIQLEQFLAQEEENAMMNTERLQRELQSEFDAREAMHHEEKQQCHNEDSFWGIQAEEARQEAANISMALEEAASRQFGEDILEQALNVAWEAEVQQNVAKEFATRGGQEQRMQARYLRWFYGQCASVDQLLDYRWPNKQQQERLEEAQSPVKRRRQPVAQLPQCSIGSATPYPLDDLVVRARLEHGDLRYGLRSILTVHHQYPRGTNGTHFEITKAAPECAFDEATAAALLKNSISISPSHEQLENTQFDETREYYDDLGGPTSLERQSSINYRRSEMPDPHIPARFNGVPYKPNQISPTHEILSGGHRKLNQLPALANSKFEKQAPKLRQLQKAKARGRAKSKASGSTAQHLFNTGNNVIVEKGRESGGTFESNAAPENRPRAQFVRQEHEVLSQLFALMDVDGSGTVNQDEMRWALQRDEEINALARTSPLLRLLLKQRTHLEALFSTQDGPITDTNPARGDNRNELSLEEFLTRCEHCHLRLMSEGLIHPDSVVTAPGTGENSLGANLKNVINFQSEQSEKEAEAHTIRRVFALLDIDQNGVLDVAEVRQALYDSAATPKRVTRSNSAGEISKELNALVNGSRALQPMLHEELFMTAFSKFEPLDARGISEEEFVAFCLEIAQVAAVNNM